MNHSPEVCLFARNNRLNFRDDQDYDPDTRSVLRSSMHGLVLLHIGDFDQPVWKTL